MTSGMTGATTLVLPTDRPRLAGATSLGLLVLPTGRQRFTGATLTLFLLPAGRPRFFGARVASDVSFLVRGILASDNPR